MKDFAGKTALKAVRNVWRNTIAARRGFKPPGRPQKRDDRKGEQRRSLNEAYHPPAVREEAEYICEVTGKLAVAGLVMRFWYGSSHDMHRLKVDMCDEVAEDVLKMLQSKYPQFQAQEEEDFTRCPLCRRHA